MKRFSNGFTLIELLVVIAVLGVLASGVVVAINPLKRINQANDANIKSDIGQIVNAMQAYYTQYKSYPTQVSDLVTSGELKSEPLKPDNTSYTITTSPSGCTTAAKDCTEATIREPLGAPTTPGASWEWNSTNGQVGESL